MEDENNILLNSSSSTETGDEKNENSLPTDDSDEVVYTSEWLKSNTSIHGWLTFFLFAICLGGVISAFSSVFSIKAEDYANNVFLICTDVLPGLFLLGVAIYTVYAFNERKPNAVFYGNVYVALVLITNALAIWIGDFDDHGLNTMKHAVRGVIWSFVWFFYLLFSTQVSEIIPPEFRKISKRDWMTLAGIIMIPVVCFLVGYIQIQNEELERTQKANQLLTTQISGNERTDGKMIFTIPSSFVCKEENVEVEKGIYIKVYNIENDTIGSCTLCSDFDTDITRRNFNDYRKNWKDDEASKYQETEVDEGSLYIKDKPCLYKVTSYDINGVTVYWRFLLLFDKETGKVAVLSCYDRNENTDYVMELLHSIRFN